jgi:ubiquinone biosynthesis protein
MRVILAWRTVVILLLVARYAAAAALAAGPLHLAGRRDRARRLVWRQLVALLQRLGPAFIKVGQILGTRRDLLPEALCAELAVLRCQVPPISLDGARAALLAAYGGRLDTVFAELDLHQVASGSIACVYRGRLHDDRCVAVKLRRPGVCAVMARDLALIKRAGAVLARLPIFHGTPVRAIVGELCDAAALQVDFVREAANLTELRRNLAAVPRVWVPRVEADACRDGVLVMEFIPALCGDAPERCSPSARRAFAANTLSAMYQMLFVNGFVHCDLHRGNLYFTAQGRVVILDAGFSVQLTDRLRRLFAEFFMYMGEGAGRRCAEVVIQSAATGTRPVDTAWFIEHMARLVERSSRVTAQRFSLIRFAAEMFDLQRRSGLHGASELVFPLLSLLVIEGTVKELDPDIDFQNAARSTVMRALFSASAAS